MKKLGTYINGMYTFDTSSLFNEIAKEIDLCDECSSSKIISETCELLNIFRKKGDLCETEMKIIGFRNLGIDNEKTISVIKNIEDNYFSLIMIKTVKNGDIARLEWNIARNKKEKENMIKEYIFKKNELVIPTIKCRNH